MADIAQLTEDEKRDIIETYKTKLLNLQQEISRVKGVLEKLGYDPGIQATSLFTSTDKEYRTSWSWTLKIKYALQKLNQTVTTRDIIAKILELEPSLKQKDIINSISSTISTKATKGIIFKRYQPYPGSDYFVGLSEWFNDLQVLPEYKGD